MKIGTSGDVINVDVLVAGDALSFSFNLSTYPASLWSLEFALSLNGSKTLSKAGTATGDTHNVALLSADTLNLKCGKCQVWLIFTKIADTTQRFTLDAGLLSVLPNPLGILPATDNALALAAIKRTIQQVISQPESTASYNGQSYSMHNIKDLYDIRNNLQAAVDAELREIGISSKTGHKTIRTRFV
jgi:hypothetical protein